MMKEWIKPIVEEIKTGMTEGGGNNPGDGGIGQS